MLASFDDLVSEILVLQDAVLRECLVIKVVKIGILRKIVESRWDRRP